MSNSTLYEQDFYAWAQEQAALLRSGRFFEADFANIAEEIESIGKSEKRELVNRLALLLARLLKCQFQPTFRGNRWLFSIEEQRARLADHLADNPSLKAALPDLITTAYRLASIGAARATGLGRESFPRACLWSFKQIKADDFWPGIAE